MGKYELARTYMKLYARRTEGWAEAEMCDLQFDGGEWSYSAWAEQYEEERDKTTQDVADAYGVSYEEVVDNVDAYLHAECIPALLAKQCW